MIAIGISWVLFWALVSIFHVDPETAALVTGVVFILVGLLWGERPFLRRG